MPPTVKAAVRSIADALTTHSATPQLDAELLVAHAVQHDRAWLVGHPEDKLSATAQKTLAALVAQRQTGIPLAYLTGTKEFYGRPFIVTSDVLIPRPDSESIIEAALKYLKKIPQPTVLEIGTGSGCLAITLAAELPSATVTATDISPAALTVAHHNATALNVADRITFRTQDLLQGETGHYDLLVANLPYVPAHWLTDANKKRYHLVNEPRVALHGGADGMNVFTTFLQQFAAHPVSDCMILEHGDEQSEAVKQLIDHYLPRATSSVIIDLTGRKRGWSIKTTRLA